MSNYVDRFIKQHKEYFQRNKIVIENNPWNQSKVTEDKIQELFDRVAELKKKNTKSSEKEIKRLQTEIFKTKEAASKRKSTLFAEETELTSSILGRLSAFIKETEKSGDRNSLRVQNFINSTVAIINIHIKKCDIYLDYSMDELADSVKEDEEELELRSEEIRFQDNVFSKKIKIQDTLDNLNITNSIDNIVVEFYEDKKATIPMKDVLCKMNRDVKRKVEALDIDWDLIIDNEFMINKDPESIPVYNPDKHFFEQDKETLQFWVSEFNKIKNGFEIDGYYIHGWLYFHLNYFKTPIGDEKDEIMLPKLRDNEWYWHEILKKAEQAARDLKDAGVFIFGTRRFSKSTCEASFTHYKMLINPSKNGTLTATNDKDIESITDKINIGLEHIDSAFYVHTNARDWKKLIKFGLKSRSGREYKLFYLTIINTDSGSKKGGQKTAGGAPVVFVMDEAGKESFLESYNAAIPSFETTEGWKCTPFYVGTGGNEDLSAEAEKVLSDPEAFRFIEMDWDLLEWQVPKEAITWKRRKFGWFIPAQMGQRKGHRKIKRTLADFLKIKSKELEKIELYQTDWVNNTKVCLEYREKFKNKKTQLQQEKVFYPLDPEDCFMSAKNNPFNVEQAKKQKEYLIETGLWDRRRNVILSGSGKLKAELSNQDLAPFPHKGGIIEAPLLIFEDIPEQTPVENLYVASFDDVKQDDSDTDSLVSFQVWKMDTFGDEWGDNLVLSWACRPDSRREMYETWLLIQKTYNAKAFPENEDMGYKTFLEGKHLDGQWLLEAVDFTASMNITNNGKRKYGWTPRQSKKVLLGMFIEFCNEVIEVEQEDGTVKTMYGVQKIQDIGLLDEIINYKEDGNFDRISAALGAVGWMHYLKKNWILPKQRRTSNEETKKRQVNRNSLYTKNRARSLYRKSLKK